MDNSHLPGRPIKIKKINFLFFLFLLIIPSISIGAEIRTMEVEFTFAAPDDPAKQLLGYRLYKDVEQVCETNNPSVSRVTCELLTEDGTFDFTLTAYYADNSESPPSPSFPFTIVPKTPPPATLQAVITPTQTTGEIPLNISFAGTDSTGDIATYTWDFGDGTSSTDSNTSHIYAISGTYTAILYVVDQAGETHQATTTITAQPNTSSPEPPTAVLSTTSAAVGNTPLTVTFNGTDSTTPYSPITSYSWTFGDGSQANGETTSHTFTTAGTYYTQLTVVDSQGLSDTVSTPIIVNGTSPENEKPIAVINTNSTSTAQPHQFSIISVAASTHDGNIPENTLDNDLSTRWSAYGDGQWIEYDLGSENLITHLLIAFYSTQKTTFDIQVSSDRNSWNTVFSGTNSGLTLEQEQIVTQETTARYVRIVGHGRTDSAWNSITEVDIVGLETASTPSVDAPLTFFFDGLQSSDPDGVITQYNWEFGDGTTGSGPSVSHTYTSEGVYTVSLQVTDDQGETATTSTEIACDANSFPIEVGELSIDHNWITVAFENTFSEPVVIAGPPTSNDAEPVLVRIRNLNKTGFEIRLQEWDYQDGTHAEEKFNYIVLEKGTYTLDNGSKIEAGSFTGTASFSTLSLQQLYDFTPVILTQVITDNEADAVTGRIRNINQYSFEFKLQEMETTKTAHTPETIGYIAWEPGKGEISGLLYEAGMTAKSVTHRWYDLSFDTEFPDLPFFIAEMQTCAGGDTATVRSQNMSMTATQIKIEEERSRDSEVNHTKEVVGYFTIGAAAD